MNITVKDIEANHPVIVKWDKKLVENGNVTEGVLAGSSDEFLTRIEGVSEFLSRCRFIEGEGATQDIQSLRVRSKLMNMQKISGANAGAQIDSLFDVDETTPTILKQTLEAHPFTAYTLIEKQFFLTNIEHEKFVQKYEVLLSASVGYEADRVSIFGKRTLADAYAMHAMDGVLKQLDDINSNYDPTNPKSPMGKYSNIDATKDLIPQIDAMLKKYTSQGGKRKLAEIYVDSDLEADLIAEASKRETEAGDRLFFNDDGNLVFRGRPVIHLDALDEPDNSYGHVIMIANPDSIAYYPVEKITSESQYKLEYKSYLTSVDMFFDTGIIFAEDVLYAVVDYTPSADSDGE